MSTIIHKLLGLLPMSGNGSEVEEIPTLPGFSETSTVPETLERIAVREVRNHSADPLARFTLLDSLMRLVLFLVGYLWMLAIPSSQFGQRIYIDENGLQPAQVCYQLYHFFCALPCSLTQS